MIKSIQKAALFFLVLVLLTECALRIVRGSLFSRSNFIVEQMEAHRVPSQYDPLLGWIPKPEFRSNGPSSIQGEPYAVVVGDSFTYGDEVRDEESWPAWLERKLGKRVLNGGVCGYGLDQSFLRLKEILKRYSPKVAIFSFIDDDIHRAELSVRNLPKPFFQLAGGGLELQGVPVPKSLPLEERMGIFGIAGYSLLFSQIALRWFPHALPVGRVRKVSSANGTDIACEIFRQLGVLSEKKQIPILVVALEKLKNPAPLDCLDPRRTVLLDLGTVTEKWNGNPALFASPGGHLSSAGNAVIADLISRKISP